MSHSVVLEKFYGMEAYADTPNAPSPAPSAPAPAVISPQTPQATETAPAVIQTQKAPAIASTTASTTAPATPATTVIVMPPVPAPTPPTTAKVDEEKYSFWDSTLFITLISIIGCIVLFLVIFFLFKAFYRPQVGGKMRMRVRRA
jgi:uncharacterized membrane protein